MRFIDDQTITQCVDAVGKVAGHGERYHDALTAFRAARDAANRAGARHYADQDADERAILEENKRHALAMLEFRRDALLKSLAAVSRLVDDRPKALQAASS